MGNNSCSRYCRPRLTCRDPLEQKSNKRKRRIVRQHIQSAYYKIEEFTIRLLIYDDDDDDDKNSKKQQKAWIMHENDDALTAVGLLTIFNSTSISRTEIRT